MVRREGGSNGEFDIIEVTFGGSIGVGVLLGMKRRNGFDGKVEDGRRRRRNVITLRIMGGE